MRITSYLFCTKLYKTVCVFINIYYICFVIFVAGLLQLTKFYIILSGRSCNLRTDRIFLFNYMKILKYNDYLVREDGLFLNSKTNELVPFRKDKYGLSIVNNKAGSMYVKDIMCFLFFGYKMSFSLLIVIDYLKSKENNSIFNFKLYPRGDKYNKSGKYIVLSEDYKFLVFDCKKQIGKFDDILEAFNFIKI